jgi:hypothetical protein
MRLQDLPTQLWDQFLSDGDESTILAALLLIPIREPPRDVDYPEFHRICDLKLAGQAYRVTRLVDMGDGQERLFIKATDVPNLTDNGVPYRLRGVALQRWICDERASPSKGPVSWKQYLDR